MYRETALAVLASLVLFAGPIRGEDGSTIDPPPRGLRVQLLAANGCDGTRDPAPFIAGDNVTSQIRVDGLTAAFDGRMDFSFRLDLLDGRGNSVKSVPWQRINYAAGLGGDTFTFSGRLKTIDVAAGQYKIRVSIKDEVAGKSTTDELTVAILENTTFGATNAAFTMDQAGNQTTPGVFFAGQNGFLHFQFCGFAHTNDDIHVEATLTVCDENGTPLGTKPIRISGKSETLEQVRDGRLSASFHLGLSRAGRFILRLSAEDVLSGKTSTRDLPIHVIELVNQPTKGTAARSVPAIR